MTSSIDHLKEKLDDAFRRSVPVLPPEELYSPITYALSIGGKRIRPLLVLLGNDLFGGIPESAVPSAIGIELFHNFTLLHDDIMDKAPLRRGKETVYRKWGINTAILSGDTMFVLAYDSLLKTSVQYLPSILSLFNKTAREVCEGQQFDMNYETVNEVSIPEYMNMIRLKTAVLLACSLRAGAITADAGYLNEEQMYSFGENLGMAFQLQDDLLDVYGDEKKFGKMIGGDILAGKKTYLYLKALEVSSGSERGAIIDLYNRNPETDSMKVEKVKKVFDDLGIANFTMQEIDGYFSKAIYFLDAIQIDGQRKTDLRNMAASLLNRQS
ncbi:MAG: polyprenyl synthetase family protein [Bacteroidota bacterium]